MPAYSQSTIQRRSPSAMKFAFRRSLWQGRSSRGPSALLDAAGDGLRARIRTGHAAAAREHGLSVFLDDPERVEPAGDRRPVVDRAQGRRHAGDRRGRRELVGRDRRALDEAGHEAALGLDEGDHLGPDADLGRDQRRPVLGTPVDPEQIRVLPADADDERLRADRDLEVVVRQPAAEPLDARLAPGPEALADLVDAHGRS